uniref:Uncharacterized protein n=1 Tax=uncultured bacterium Contig12 TaxID=1393397 RepID=W0FIT9_9BACT|nr:hypothetical protein [uncultured bacterium Contig12]
MNVPVTQSQNFIGKAFSSSNKNARFKALFASALVQFSKYSFSPDKHSHSSPYINR